MLGILTLFVFAVLLFSFFALVTIIYRFVKLFPKTQNLLPVQTDTLNFLRKFTYKIVAINCFFLILCIGAWAYYAKVLGLI